MANTPKTPQELYDEITSAFAQAELVGNELQSQLPAADLPEYLAASVIESVIEATDFRA